MTCTYILFFNVAVNFLCIELCTYLSSQWFDLAMALQSDADMFYNTFNGQRYNSIEPDICRLVYVARVETTKESENGGLPIPGEVHYALGIKILL